MHDALVELRTRLEAVVEGLQQHIPSDEPFGNAHNNWSFPGLTKAELIEEVESTLELLKDHDTDNLGDAEARVRDYVQRLDHLAAQTVPNIWSNAGQGVGAFQLTIQGLDKVLVGLGTDEEKVEESRRRLRELRTQLRAVEAELGGLEPRTGVLADMVERIELAYRSADRLPTDLESLAEARARVSEIVEEVSTGLDQVLAICQRGEEVKVLLNAYDEEARVVLAKCESAYAAATSVGLAAAFSERSVELARSMWFWIGGLAVSLVAGSYMGSNQLRALSAAFSAAESSGLVITVNVLLSILSVGAPVWFAWLSTKQIGQRFRLAEDYGFKASVARAYEGFRSEAARFDKGMEARLLGSALARLDELPLRLVEEKTYGSPWHELASSDVVQRAMIEAPGFAGQIKALARRAIGSVGSRSRGRRSSPTAPETGDG